DHLCQGKCTRINYDDPLQIREVKRFISEHDNVSLNPAPDNGKKAAVIGAGPAGLSCAYYLRMAGFKVDVFEARSKAGGMVQYAIPGFRLTDGA
ncbi:MAG: FAD-dependent oxidoreductase, partial [Bacteroidales bacterium]